MAEELESVLLKLADEGRPVRTIDLSSLSDIPRMQVTAFRMAWDGLSARRRLELLSAMVEQAEANIHLNFHVILRECLNDADAQIRRLSVEGLWEDERVSLVHPLVALLVGDPALEVRAAAAVSLGRFVLKGVLGEIPLEPASHSQEALRAAWSRPGEATEVRRRALEGLAYTNDPDLRELIENAYYDEDVTMRQSAVFAMGRSVDGYWARYVLAELGSPDAAMRYEAASASGELMLISAVRPLIRLLDDPDGAVREAAALALGKIGGREARRALEAILNGSDERLAEAAGDALDELTFNDDSLDDPQMKRRDRSADRSAWGRGEDEDEEDEDLDDEDDHQETLDDGLWADEEGYELEDGEDQDGEDLLEEDDWADDEEDEDDGDDEDWR